MTKGQTAILAQKLRSLLLRNRYAHSCELRQLVAARKNALHSLLHRCRRRRLQIASTSLSTQDIKADFTDVAQKVGKIHNTFQHIYVFRRHYTGYATGNVIAAQNFNTLEDFAGRTVAVLFQSQLVINRRSAVKTYADGYLIFIEVLCNLISKQRAVSLQLQYGRQFFLMHIIYHCLQAVKVQQRLAAAELNYETFATVRCQLNCCQRRFR